MQLCPKSDECDEWWNVEVFYLGYRMSLQCNTSICIITENKNFDWISPFPHPVGDYVIIKNNISIYL